MITTKNIIDSLLSELNMITDSAKKILDKNSNMNSLMQNAYISAENCSVKGEEVYTNLKNI